MNFLFLFPVARISESIKVNKCLASPSVKLGHVLVLKSLLNSSEGIDWILNNSGWMTPIDYCIENQTVYVVREAQNFTKKIIFTAFDNVKNESVCREILSYAASSIKEAVIVYNGIVCIDSADLQRKVSPTISLLCIILNDCIQNREKQQQQIADITLLTFNAEVNLWRLISMTKNPIFFKEIMLAHVYVNCTQMSTKSSEFYQRFFDHINYCIANTNPMAMIAVANLYYVLYNSELKNYNISTTVDCEMFENQIFLIIFMPITYLIGEHEKCNEYRKFNHLLMKYYQISLDDIQKRCANLHEYFSNNRNILETTCSNAIQTLITMRSISQEIQLNTIFNILMELLDIIEIDLLISIPKFLSSILSGLYTIIKINNFISGKNLMNKMLQLLEFGNLDCRVS